MGYHPTLIAMQPIILTSADSLDDIALSASHIVLFITEREVKAALVGDIVDRLMTISDRSDLTRQFAGRISICIDGYNEDPRELAEIPEVVSLFRAIDAQWPYWFHFLSLEDRSLDTVFMMLLDVQRRPQAPGESIRLAFDPEGFRSALLAKIKAMNALHDLHEFDEARAREISDRVLARINEILE